VAYTPRETVKEAKNEQENATRLVMAELDRLGSLTVKDDSIKFEGDKIILPARFSGDLLGMAQFLEQIHEQEEEEFGFGRTFKYRPWDGAAAFQRAMYRVFGTVGLGKATQTFFGKIPPQLRTISVGPKETLQVPWGEVNMPTMNAVFDLDGAYDPEYGLLFRINVTAPRKHRARLEAFFNVIQDELEQRSIYKGRAFNGAEEPEFIDLSKIDESKVVYSDEVMTQLNSNLWSLIEHTDTMVKLGIPLKRAVLLEGPFGTGKTLAGALTAKRAEANGWTFILARPGKDDIFEVLNTAKLYAPAVVQFEDIDVVASKGSESEISRLLDALDGIGNKTNGVVALFTTNYVEQLQKGVMRPGRIDSIIRIAELDRNGTEKLIRSVVDSSVLGDIDFDVVYAQVKDFLPAFVKEAVDRAVRYAVSRGNGNLKFTIETDDIVNAAIGLQHQLDLMNDAQHGVEKKPAIDEAIGTVVKGVVDAQVTDILHRTTMADTYDFKVKDANKAKSRR
jgi:hypothetical protein